VKFATPSTVVSRLRPSNSATGSLPVDGPGRTRLGSRRRTFGRRVGGETEGIGRVLLGAVPCGYERRNGKPCEVQLDSDGTAKQDSDAPSHGQNHVWHPLTYSLQF
jgi:hypothetical protein